MDKTALLVTAIIGAVVILTVFFIIPMGNEERNNVAEACLSGLEDKYEISSLRYLRDTDNWYCHLETKKGLEYDFCIREVVETKNHGFRIIANTCEVKE